MINIFKKKDDEKTVIIGDSKTVSGSDSRSVSNPDTEEKINSVENSQNSHLFSPPTNLPDLAKDMYDNTVQRPVSEKNDLEKMRDDLKDMSKQQKFARIPTEPVSASVPNLDLNLIRRHDTNDNIVPGAKNATEQTRTEPVNDKKIFYPEREYLQQPNLNFVRGEALFDYIENLIHTGKFKEANMLLSNIVSSLNEFHGKGIDELKDLEKIWLFMKHKSDAVNTLLYGVETEISLKSLSLASNYAGSNQKSVNNLDRNVLNEDFMQLLKKTSTEGVSQSNIDRADSKNTDFFVDDGRFFYVSNGLVLKSLRELINALHSIPDEIFYFHVNSEKNDFANWVNDVLNRRDIADNIRKYYSKKGLIGYLESLFR